MEVNKDEALRCLNIARTHFDSGNTTLALKFARKSFSLFPSADADDLIKTCQSTPSSPPSAESSSPLSTSKSSAQPSSSNSTNLRNRDGQSGIQREYTFEQVEAVKRIKACDNDYYKILGVERKCEEIEIKKSYKKLALQFHPDKNAAPGADEAFKMISKAFTILSDKRKRMIYDAGGMDPEQRSAGVPSGFGGMRGFQGSFQGEEINPEELFNMFFGGDPFGGGYQSATFYGPGIRTRTFRTGGSRTHANQQQPQSTTFLSFLQLLPLLVLLLFSFTSSIFSGETSPNFSLQATSVYTTARQTPHHKVSYWVNPGQFSSIGSNPGKLQDFERRVETTFVQLLQRQCQREREEKVQQMSIARGGPFGIGKNVERLKELEKKRLEACSRLIEEFKIRQF